MLNSPLHSTCTYMTKMLMQYFTLFSVDAGNRTVAGAVSKPGFKVGKMEPVTPGPGEYLGGLFQDMPTELTEADYLDSFMDLSNFLIEVIKFFNVKLEIFSYPAF